MAKARKTVATPPPLGHVSEVRPFFLLLFSVLTLTFSGLWAASPDTPSQAETSVAKHALRGVVREVKADRSALVVKHEEIPGVMRAMTMLFVVSAEDLAKVKAGDQITGLMSRRGRDWVLEEIRVVPPSS